MARTGTEHPRTVRSTAPGGKGKRADAQESGRAKLDRAYEGLEQEVPDPVARAIRWLRDPRGKWVRLPLGMLLVVAGFFGFLPVLGFEFIPLGLLLIAQDVPPLRRPVADATLWLERKWVQFRTRRRRTRRSSSE